jgi:hypothetical protein
MISRSAESAYLITATDAAEANVSFANYLLFVFAGKCLKATFLEATL